MKISTENRGQREPGSPPPARTVNGGKAAEPAANAERTNEERTNERRTTEPGAESLAAAAELARMSAQDALTAGVFLLVVLVGIMSQLIGGIAIVQLVLLVPVTACFSVSLALVIRSRRTLARALGELRRGTSAPLYPFPPWTPYASSTPLGRTAFEHELRQLVSAAGRCCVLAGQAEAWAAATGLLFVFWTLIGLPAR